MTAEITRHVNTGSPRPNASRPRDDASDRLFHLANNARLAMTMLLIILSIAYSLAFAEAPPTDPYPFTSTADAARFSTLTRQVRCIVCQHQSIADSGTPIAAGLRQKVYQMVLDKKSDREIKNYLVRRYGEFILLDPRVNSKTMLLWLFPLLGLAIGILMLVRLF